jgi:hypothetical protein
LQLELKLDYAGQNVGHKVEMQSWLVNVFMQ